MEDGKSPHFSSSALREYRLHFQDADGLATAASGGNPTTGATGGSRTRRTGVEQTTQRVSILRFKGLKPFPRAHPPSSFLNLVVFFRRRLCSLKPATAPQDGVPLLGIKTDRKRTHHLAPLSVAAANAMDGGDVSTPPPPPSTTTKHRKPKLGKPIGSFGTFEPAPLDSRWGRDGVDTIDFPAPVEPFNFSGTSPIGPTGSGPSAAWGQQQQQQRRLQLGDDIDEAVAGRLLAPHVPKGQTGTPTSEERYAFAARLQKAARLKVGAKGRGSVSPGSAETGAEARRRRGKDIAEAKRAMTKAAGGESGSGGGSSNVVSHPGQAKRVLAPIPSSTDDAGRNAEKAGGEEEAELKSLPQSNKKAAAAPRRVLPLTDSDEEEGDAVCENVTGDGVSVLQPKVASSSREEDGAAVKIQSAYKMHSAKCVCK